MTEADITPGEEDAALAGEYALGLLSASEARAFEDRMAAEPALRAQYARWAEAFADLVDGLPQETPPPSTFDDIEDRLFPLQKRRSLLGGLRGLVMAAVSVVLILVAVSYFDRSGGPRSITPDFVAALAVEDRDLMIDISATRDGTFVVALNDTVLPPEGQDYELWLVAGDAAPVSLGVVPRIPDAAWADIPSELIAQFAGGAIAVSLEPAGGAPNGTPTEVLGAVAITEL